MKNIPSVVVPIIINGKFSNENLYEVLKNKKTIIFGVPGAFTPTCSEKHLPGFLKLCEQIKNKGIDDIYCMSVNDKFVMQSWLLSYSEGYKIKGIADGNAEISSLLDVICDKSSNFMGVRCMRFAMIIDDAVIINSFFEENGEFQKTSAENILLNL